jgi:hypothetical protein
MTKWHNDQHRFQQDNDLPIVANYGPDENRSFYCECQRRMIKLQNNTGNISYFCSNCNTTENNPEGSELRTASDIYAPEGVNKIPLATTKFVDKTVGKQPRTIKGGLKALTESGRIRVTSYQETGKE